MFLEPKETPRLPERYRLIRRIGGGATAEVFLAEDGADPGVRKAVKVLRAELGPALVASFRDEFRILASLDHPGIARVYEFGELGEGRAYYAAEYVDGEELGAGDPVPVGDSCVAVAAVCRALAYVHSRGYLHNDVKPANVRVGGAPESARLLDFGLAALARAGSRAVAGTPGYIAPERLAGLACDGRADLYSVGATLYRVLGGRRVVEAEDPAQALAELRRGWPRLDALRPDVPSTVADLVEALLQLEPSARPRHAFEIISALGDAVGAAIPLETPGTSRCYSLSSVFVGRGSQVADLEQALRQAKGGDGPRVLAVAGGAGVGKSRVLREIAWRAATSGWRAATAVCAERGGPLDPIPRLLAQLGAPSVSTDSSADASIEALLRAAGARPTLLVIDNAHHAADPAFNVAFSAARAASSSRAPLVVLLGLDPDSLSASRRQRAAFAGAAGEMLRVELGPLSRGEIQRLLDSLFGEGVIGPRAHELVAQRCGGNPLLLEEIVREMVETGVIRSTPTGWVAGDPPTGPTSHSPRLEDFLRRRCSGLPSEAQAALASLVALGGHAELDAVVSVSDAKLDAQYGVALLADRGLVTVQAGEIALAHLVLASLALEGVPVAERRALHRAAARWLVAHGADDAELAHAWREAGEAGVAFDHAVRAGTNAKEIGEGKRAYSLLEQAVALAGEAGIAGSRLSEVLVTCAGALGMLGRHGDGLTALERAYDLAPATDRCRIAALAARAAVLAGRHDDGAGWLDRARENLLDGDHTAAALLELSAGNYAWDVLHDYEQARARMQEGLDRLERYRVTGAVADSLRARLLFGLTMVEEHFDLRGTRVLKQAALDVAIGSGDRSLLEVARTNLANASLREGDARSARALLTETLQESERLGNVNNLLYIVATLAEASHMCGAWGEAHEHLRRVAAAAEGSTVFVPAILHALRASFAWREGDLALAAREANAALFGDAPILWREFLFLTLAISAAGAAKAGDAAAAARLADRAEAHARVIGAPVDRLQADVARAYAATAVDPLRGGALLRDAAQSLEATGFRRDVAPILRDAARALMRGGDSEGARACVAKARLILTANDCTPALRLLDRLLEEGEGALESDLGSARDLEELARRFPAAARAAGFAGEIRLCTRAPEALEAGEQCLAVETGNLHMWLVAREASASHALPLVALGARTALAALEVRHAKNGEAGGFRKHPEGHQPGEPPRDSRLLELTLGPIELRHSFEGVIGRSPAMTRALGILDRLADSDAPVLLTGETGTGKEVFARALHAASSRSKGPFVTVNCSALPPSLFEAELFGYRRGAFTGAVRDHAGLAREADGGMLFLDEVGELPIEMQPKLLRLLQERRVRPVGGDRETPVDLRLVTATNRELAADVAQGRFRSDLFYRINVVEIRLPALRERLPDIPELARHLLSRLGHQDQAIAPGALRRLLDYEWPGNVRELENELQRASILAGGGGIEERHLSARVRRRAPAAPAPTGTLADRLLVTEREMLVDALERAKGNRTHAAKALGLTRAGLFKKMRRLGL